MNSPLSNLHSEFTEAYRKHIYLGSSPQDPQIMTQATHKKIRLQQVFRLARQEIENGLQREPPRLQISRLRALKNDGRLYYERYVQSTNRWSRVFLKGLAHYTPTFLKRFLPACFSNRMAEAEQETQQEYESYKSFLQQNIERLSRPGGARKNHSKLAPLDDHEPLDLDKLDKQDQVEAAKPKAINQTKALSKGNLNPDDKDIELQNILSDAYSKYSAQPPEPLPAEQLKKSKSENFIQEQTNPLLSQSLISIISKQISYLNQFEKRSPSLNKYKQVLNELAHHLQRLSKLDKNAQKSLEKIFNEAAFKVFTNAEFIEALKSDNDPQILALLKSTAWERSFEKALAHKGEVTFQVQTLAKQTLLIFKNEQGIAVKEIDFQNFQGKILLNFAKEGQIAASDQQVVNVLTEYLKFVSTHPQCQPYQIDIEFAGRELIPEILLLLISLSESVPDIQIHGLQAIDLTSLEDERSFIQSLDRFHFPDVKQVIFSDESQENWSSLDFFSLLSACPQREILELNDRVCSSPENLMIPFPLSQTKELDLRKFSATSLPHLLQQFNGITHLNLEGLPITDQQLQDLIKNGNLTSLQVLNLENCASLTTDSLSVLMTLDHLINLSLPDLPQGKLSLKTLPKFDDPFKIKRFYLASKATQQIASSLYKGPILWAAVFQIPLARMGISGIFASPKETLDPKSVAYWLHLKDYRHLKSEPAITTIKADFNAALDDETLVDFVQKFPNVTSLNLSHCPQITHRGVIRLLEACPKIHTLDLTDCANVTAELFVGDTLYLFARLQKLIISNAKIDSELLFEVKTALFTLYEVSDFIQFEETHLKITDDQLTDEENFEAILLSNDLSTLKYLDLSGCTNLTNQMLGGLLDRLNADLWIEGEQPNPQRLNLAVLNLAGCSQISDEAFKVKDKADFKYLEILGSIVTAGTNISEALKKVYPHIHFEASEPRSTIQINPERQLDACHAYFEKRKENAINNQEGQNLIHHRIVVDLFASSCLNQELVKQVIDEPFDIHEKEFCDFLLSLRISETSQAQPIFFPMHRDVLASQSSFFSSRFNPGGILAKPAPLTLTNAYFSPKAVQVIKDLIYGNVYIEDLDWNTAAKVAEIAGPNFFQLPLNYYQALLHRVHSQFDLDRADEMCLVAQKLEDVLGLEQYQQILLNYLDMCAADMHANQEMFIKISNLAKSHPFPLLKYRVHQIESIRNEAIINQMTAENNLHNEKLFQNLIGNRD